MSPETKAAQEDRVAEEKLWYEEGLRFECLRCGRCCAAEPGRVRVSDGEVASLAAQLGLTESEFRTHHTRRSRGPELLLVEKRNRDCTFFDPRRGCTVYRSRPQQCRTWPFWSAALASPESWSAQAKHCRGMNRGPLHSVAAIRRLTAAGDGISKRSTIAVRAGSADVKGSSRETETDCE